MAHALINTVTLLALAGCAMAQLERTPFHFAEQSIQSCHRTSADPLLSRRMKKLIFATDF